jgi:hypothetical protein
VEREEAGVIIIGVTSSVLLVVALIARDAGWRPGSARQAWFAHTTEVVLWTIFAVIVMPQLIRLVA